MAIDLNALHRLQRLRVACQAENNVPVVGKEQVARGREMHWIRIDRYFVGDDDERPAGRVPADACQHCENAPCENVCPVNATAHSPEGLNDMAYNRCIGTRYCANNCPYKVRRFNFLNYQRVDESPRRSKMQFNPDVTRAHPRRDGEVHATACSASRSAKIARQARRARELKDGDVVTACQQACPTEAIVFGDLNDPNSEVAQAARGRPQLRAARRARHAARARASSARSAIPNPEMTEQSDELPNRPDRRDRRDPLLAGAHDASRSITETGQRASPRTSAPLGWWICFGISLDVPGRARRLGRLPVLGRHRRLGQQQPGRLGVGHHQLRLLDRYRPRRHADQRRSCSCSGRSGARRSTASPRR